MLKRTSNRRTSTFLMLTSQKKGSQETMSLTNYTSQIGQKNSSLAPHFSSYSGIVNMYYFNKFTPEELAPTPWCLPYPRVLLSPLSKPGAWQSSPLLSPQPNSVNVVWKGRFLKAFNACVTKFLMNANILSMPRLGSYGNYLLPYKLKVHLRNANYTSHRTRF